MGETTAMQPSAIWRLWTARFWTSWFWNIHRVQSCFNGRLDFLLTTITPYSRLL